MKEPVWQSIMAQFEPPEVLYYASNHRRRIFYAPLDSLPETMYMPLYEALRAASLDELPSPQYAPKTRVAIYKRLPRKGEYCKNDWYEYAGDGEV